MKNIQNGWCLTEPGTFYGLLKTEISTEKVHNSDVTVAIIVTLHGNFWFREVENCVYRVALLMLFPLQAFSGEQWHAFFHIIFKKLKMK